MAQSLSNIFCHIYLHLVYITWLSNQEKQARINVKSNRDSSNKFLQNLCRRWFSKHLKTFTEYKNYFLFFWVFSIKILDGKMGIIWAFKFWVLNELSKTMAWYTSNRFELGFRLSPLLWSHIIKINTVGSLQKTKKYKTTVNPAKKKLKSVKSEQFKFQPILF